MEHTWKPTAAGILCIVAGAAATISGLWLTVLGGVIGVPFGVGWMGAFAVPWIVFGVIAIVGGVYSLKRRAWGLALAGSICALSGYFILGLLAIIFVAMGKNEFE